MGFKPFFSPSPIRNSGQQLRLQYSDLDLLYRKWKVCNKQVDKLNHLIRKYGFFGNIFSYDKISRIRELWKLKQTKAVFYRKDYDLMKKLLTDYS